MRDTFYRGISHHFLTEIFAQIKLCGGLKSRKFKEITQRMQKLRWGDDPHVYFLTVQIAADDPETVRIIEII